MKPVAHPHKLTTGEPRTLPAADRFKGFHALKARYQASDADVSMDETRWHTVDEERPLEGYDELPPALAGGTRTPELWIKFRDPSVGRVVVSRGRYDYDGGTWTARLSSVEDGDVVGTVVAVAWARIVPAERPWDGLIVPTHAGDAW
jgi:hypothetical protein